MSGTETLWSIPGAGAVAWALVSFLWQGALVTLALAGALFLVPAGSPRLRYALASGALLVMFLLPVGTALTPRKVSLGGHPDARDERKDLGGRTSPSPRSFRLVPRPQDDSASKLVPMRVNSQAIGEIVEPWLPSLFAGWLAGIVLLSLWHAGGWARARRLVRRDTREVEEVWRARLGELCERMRIGRAVELLESARVSVPAVIGWLSPVILVPASVFSGLTPRQLEAVLAHELAHVRRHDYLINLLQTLVETLLFYHPAVWWVSRQVRIERESCCDDLALEVCGGRLGYARALAALEELRAPRFALAANGGDLLSRIRRLVAAPAPSAARPSAWLAGALAVAFLLSAAAVQSARRPAPGAPAAPAAPGTPTAPAAPGTPTAPAARAPLPPLPPTPPGSPAAPLSTFSSTSGTWNARREKDGRVWLQMEMREVTANGRHEESHSDEIPEKDLIGLGAGPEVRFELRRAAGTFQFQGRFKAGIGAKGEGRFTFRADPSYLREMTSLGFAVQAENLIQLAMVDLSPAFAREIRNAGYSRLSLEELVRFRIHDVSADFIRQLADLGYRELSPDDLVRLHIHGVTPESIAELVRLGYRDVSPDDLVRMKIHGVSAAFVREQGQKAGRNLPVDELIRIKIHGK